MIVVKSAGEVGDVGGACFLVFVTLTLRSSWGSSRGRLLLVMAAIALSSQQRWYNKVKCVELYVRASSKLQVLAM